MKVEKVVERFQ